MALTKASYSMITGAPRNVLDFGADPTGVADSTSAIEAAFTLGGAVYFPTGTYLYAPSAATGFLSNTMIFGDGASSIIKYSPLTPPTTTDIQQILRPRAYANVDNIVIRDITLDGNRAGVTWTGVVGDGGAFGIGLWGTQNVFIDNVTAKNCWTDGFFLAYSHSSLGGSRRQCKNIRIGSIYAENCGRQGMSIISAEDVVIGEFYVNGVNRTAPRAAIDMEPDNASPDLIKNISIGSLVAKDVGAGLLLSGVSTIENISIGSVSIQNVTNTFGVSITRAKNVEIGQVNVTMASTVFYSLYMTDVESVYIGAFRSTPETVKLLTGVQGGVIIDVLPGGAVFTNDNIRIDYLYQNGADGNGFRQDTGSVSIGYIKLVDVAQGGGGAVAAALLATAVIEYIVADDGSGDYAVLLGSNNNRLLSGSLANGNVSAISLSGYRADFGSTRVNGQAYQNNFYSGTGSPESVVTANVGALYFRLDGGAGTTLYVKQTGTGNTGWAAK